jgi:VanZ family protein
MLVFNVLKEYKLGNKKLIGFSILFAGLYAVTDEIHQTFVSGRSAEVRDVLIDTIGASIGVVLYWAILRIIKKRRLTENAKV